ncbi:MAG: hypothetical protein ACHQIM_22550 [Sphingobacteriales bacterium]
MKFDFMNKTGIKKTRLLKNIKQGLKEVKAIRAGKAKSYSMSDLFDGK